MNLLVTRITGPRVFRYLLYLLVIQTDSPNSNFQSVLIITHFLNSCTRRFSSAISFKILSRSRSTSCLLLFLRRLIYGTSDLFLILF